MPMKNADPTPNCGMMVMTVLVVVVVVETSKS
jgi:hypothetical protein